MQNRYAIIVAGGSGNRMKSELPKQFLLLNGKPIVMHTLERFADTERKLQLILILHANMFSFWNELCEKYGFKVPHTVIAGGETRFQSVRNGINYIAERQQQFLDNTLIAIHDAARPLITSEMIDLCFEQTIVHTATVAAVPSTNSIRHGSIEENKAWDREKVWVVQTPQTFQGDILHKAFQQDELSTFTDDASVVEKLGYSIHLILGDYRNIKITFPEDISIAQLYLNH
ncbi:2-C-methyl-D-erythritol 4-phosphate cytidylyltransferase [Sphingobacterium arenae]|uniref:2-C-methyl-D-erythritol 4-phosphate cytidylyltransferase n=1 Tax=Sphingobacterium arenae TaxID=1280598 RepID=A0ABR7Y5P9_9SPHI|nr:2-C-methyl-D-erythritol 4-phosphate cytidylyltransferase [Sphingobacterium arenae]MBD1426621.1 2-C-methyl-D-erythritol 4-phosphate cytidylyltransferase [Sphingobacterium arenae]